MKNKPIVAAAIAGTLGAVLLWIIQLVMQTQNGNPPLGTVLTTKMLPVQSATATIIGALAFFAAGAAWGAIYAIVVPRISIASGALFGLAPWLCVMLIILPMLGKPLFAGGNPTAIAIPLVLNVIWGALVAALIPKLSTRTPTV